MPAMGEEILALVRIPSVTGEERILADTLEARLRRDPVGRGNEVIRWGNSVILGPRRSATAGVSRPRVVLAGHIDTVPLGEAPAPFVSEGKVHGRGSADMKAGIAVMLALAEALSPEEGFAERAYVFYAGEEGPAEKNALREILEQEPWLVDSDLAILLEPTGGALELGCQGSIHLEVEIRGQACHSARPWLGVHPLAKALPWFDRILNYPIREVEIEGVTFKEVVSLTWVHSGEARNVIPGRLRANVNLRYSPDRSPEEAEALARTLAPPAEFADATLVDHAPAGSIDRASPLYRHLLETSGLPRRAKQAWTDVARFTERGVPALNWGPGKPELAHTQDEHVAVAEAEECLDRMLRFFRGPGPQDGHLGEGKQRQPTERNSKESEGKETGRGAR